MKTVSMLVVTLGASVRRDIDGVPYTRQTTTHRGGTRDVLGHAALDEAGVAKIKERQTMLDTVLNVEGEFPDDAVFEVQENSDQNEGRGPMRTVGFFDNFSAAFEVAKGRGVMGGGDGDILMHSASSGARRVFSTKEAFEAAGGGDLMPNPGERVYSSYFGLNGAYFKVVKNRTEEERIEADPEYAEFIRLQKKYG